MVMFAQGTRVGTMTSITCISTLPAYSQSENLLERFGLYCQLLGHECYRFQFCAWISSLCSTSLPARGQKRFTGPMTCKGARQISVDTHPGVQCRSLGADGQTSQDRRWFRGDMISVYLSGCIFVWPYNLIICTSKSLDTLCQKVLWCQFKKNTPLHWKGTGFKLNSRCFSSRWFYATSNSFCRLGHSMGGIELFSKGD